MAQYVIFKEGIMKKTQLIIGILIMVVLILIGIITFLLLNYTKLPKEYECSITNESNNDDNMTITDYQYIVINQDTSVKKTIFKTLYKFKTEEIYNQAKIWHKKNKKEYIKYNDKKFTILVTNSDSKIKNEAGEITEVWYKTLLKSITKEGYTCKKTK